MVFVSIYPGHSYVSFLVHHFSSLYPGHPPTASPKWAHQWPSVACDSSDSSSPLIWGPGLVNVNQKTMENHHFLSWGNQLSMGELPSGERLHSNGKSMFHGKIHYLLWKIPILFNGEINYFDWAMFNSCYCMLTRGYLSPRYMFF